MAVRHPGAGPRAHGLTRLDGEHGLAREVGDSVADQRALGFARLRLASERIAETEEGPTGAYRVAELDDITRAVDRAVAIHWSDPNVSLIDVGVKIFDRRGTWEPRPCVRVHVRRKLYGNAFREFRRRNPHCEVSASRIGYDVDVPQGHYRPSWGWWPRYAYYAAATVSPRWLAHNPMRGGISMASSLLGWPGTLGGKVLDRATGAPMLLSNWHVLVGEAGAPPRTSVLQPGGADGGTDAHTVATLDRHAMDDFVDAAVAALSGTRALVNDQFNLGPVMGAGEPALNTRVVKSGRTTGVTRGMISTAIAGRVKLRYGVSFRTVRDVFHILPATTGGIVSAGGDSGSWWLDEAGRALGLHCAGSDAPEAGIAIAMPAVLDALAVDIALA